jgi:DNA topoisomerase-1
VKSVYRDVPYKVFNFCHRQGTILMAKKIKQLVHGGVLIPKYEPKGFKILYNGKRLPLTPEVEEMAVAWVKKLGTDYVKDPVFVKNFSKDFSRALGIKPPAKIENFDFSEIIRWVENEKIAKENMSREERKALAETRKKIREANKERYGYAVLNGERVEIGYTVEPPSIFMGRGKHPLRGRWKPRVDYIDVVINLSPDAPTPVPPSGGRWKERVFDRNAMWVAKWQDKLSGKKYLWISDTSRFKQEREIEKFDKARELGGLLERVRQHIELGLASEDIDQRKMATVCYLIDNLKMRVGDEKGKDEVDTVGATTLRGSHIEIEHSGRVKFDFLGKDSVRWVGVIRPPAQVVSNLRSLIGAPRDPIFSGIRSEHVNAFLGQVMPGLTAKVFRTYHASKVVGEYLVNSKVRAENTDLEKNYVAKMANLQAAITCHHKRKLPKNWKKSLEKKVNTMKALKAKLKETKEMPRSRTRARRVKSLRGRLGAATLKVKLTNATRDYNLSTSLNSYIDPRLYVKWAKGVSYDWKKIYPQILQRKFAWADDAEVAVF